MIFLYLSSIMCCQSHNRGHEFRKLALVNFYFFSVFYLNFIFKHLVGYELVSVIFFTFLLLRLTQSHVPSYRFDRLT
jgi:hypothetical protein